MFPQHLLPQLSPNSAKIYLILLSLLDPRRRDPLVIAPMLRLIQLSDLSARTCSRALRQLRDLQLIRRLRRRYHAPNVYLLLPYPSAAMAHPPKEATVPSQSPTEAALSPASTSIPPRPTPQKPAPSPEIAYSPPLATLLNASRPSPTLASRGHSIKHPHLSRTLASPGDSYLPLSKHPHSPRGATLLNAIARSTLATTGGLVKPHCTSPIPASPGDSVPLTRPASHY